MARDKNQKTPLGEGGGLLVIVVTIMIMVVDDDGGGGAEDVGFAGGLTSWPGSKSCRSPLACEFARSPREDCALRVRFLVSLC